MRHLCVVCKDPEQVEIRYCPLLKNRICEGCCFYEMDTEQAEQIVRNITHKDMDLAEIIATCKKCGLRS